MVVLKENKVILMVPLKNMKVILKKNVGGYGMTTMLRKDLVPNMIKMRNKIKRKRKK